MTEIERLKAELARIRGLPRLAALDAEIERLRAACDKLGFWMSAALEDPQVCKEMKADIEEWFRALEPKP